MKRLLTAIWIAIASVLFPGCGEKGPETSQGEAAVVTLPATDLSTHGAVLHARYSGASTLVAPQNVIFRYGKSSDNLDGTVSAEELVETESGTFSARLSDLSPGCTYYFRASMSVWDPDKMRYRGVSGEVLSFKTEGVPVDQGDPDDPDDPDNPDDPDPGPPPAADPDLAGIPVWAELPVLDYTHYGNPGNYYIDNSTHGGLYEANSLYYTHHITDEKYSDGHYHRNYTCCWSAAYKCPVWVAAPRHEWYEGGSSGNRNYVFNPDMPREVQYNATSGSGTYNRGHMLGAAERSGRPSAFRQVNYITNIAPQNASWFNTGSGGWNTLEDWVDKKVCSDTLYIVIGCYFEDYKDGYGNVATRSIIGESFLGTTGVQFPTMMYYALLRTRKGNSGKSVRNCSSSELMCAAFVRAHSQGNYKRAVSSAEMMSVADLEKITGFTYFTNVPNAPKNTCNASDWGL